MKRLAVMAAILLAAQSSGQAANAGQDVEVDVDVEMIVAPGDVGAVRESPPAGEPLLRVAGIPGAREFVLDAAGLESFGIWAYTVEDPWLNERVRYSGVLLSALLAGLGAPPGADVLAVARDGYEFVIPAAQYDRWPVLLATDSDRGPLADRGPVRIIFPYDMHEDDQAARNMSVWALERLIIR